MEQVGVIKEAQANAQAQAQGLRGGEGGRRTVLETFRKFSSQYGGVGVTTAAVEVTVAVVVLALAPGVVDCVAVAETSAEVPNVLVTALSVVDAVVDGVELPVLPV
ncbi:hypothetical protein KEM55_002245 [Ascosphaera atra]|nr:hypothetical protein KEM55_002245 [Ascosphaera atra]